MKSFFYVFLGGGLGSVVRYGVGRLVNATINPDFPLGTLIVNFFASLFLGYLAGKSMDLPDGWKLLFAVGFCGGFSTFSTFSNETFLLLSSGKTTEAILNISLNLLLCLGAIFFGMQLAN